MARPTPLTSCPVAGTRPSSPAFGFVTQLITMRLPSIYYARRRFTREASGGKGCGGLPLYALSGSTYSGFRPGMP